MTGGALLAAACLAVASRGGAPAVQGAEFVDPLDRPAARSALAPHALLNAVTRAGTRLVAVGQRGHVLWSDDAGARWMQAAVPVSSDLTAVHFPSPWRGFAVGHDGVVLATADGGRSWTKRLDGRGIEALLRARYGAPALAARGGIAEQARALAQRAPGVSLLAVWFADERVGFVAGAFGLVLHTEDGGESWIPWLDRVDNPRALHLYAIGRAGGAVLLAGEQGLLLRLDHEARRFRAARVPPGGSFFALAATGRTAVIAGLGGRALRTGDAGESWQEVATGVVASVTGAAVLPGGQLVLVSQQGDVLVSGDGGRSFRRAGPAGRPQPTSSVAAADAETLVLAGPAGVRRERLR